MCKHNSWSQLYKSRRAIAARFGSIFALPIVKRVRDVLLEQVNDGACVLEVGAGDRAFQRVLADERRDVSYESMDIDPAGQHDYRSLDCVDRAYDGVCAFEVIEHLPLAEIGPWLARLRELLRPGGWLVLSTPNTFYPPAYLRDATHCTPLCYDELGGLVETAGLRVERIVRIYHDPVHRKLLRRYLFGWLFRLIGIDFARQIVLVARKP
jgi:hypothetical protein